MSHHDLVSPTWDDGLVPRKNRRLDANTHGIPLYGGDKPPPPRRSVDQDTWHVTKVPSGRRCVWPECSNWRADISTDFALCLKHANEVYDAVTVDIAKHQHHPTEVLTKKIYPNAPAEVNTVGWIYYLRIGERIKIGYTKNIRKRLQGYEPGTKLLAYHPGSKQDEAGLHQRFTPWRAARREWYEPSKAIMRHIQDVLREHGAPPDFEARKRERDLNRPFRVVRG